MLPIGKMLLVPARVIGTWEDSEGEMYYELEIYGHDLSSSIALIPTEKIDNMNMRVYRAAEEREAHPGEAWPT